MQRREFLARSTAAVGALAAAGLPAPGPAPARAAGAGLRIQTVLGPLDAAEAGIAFPHEHLFSRFGLPPAARHEYELDTLRANLVPYLKYLHALGCLTLFDCTTAWFGRDVLLLQELSKASGVHVVTNTGYYGAADDRYVPPHAHAESADALAARWLGEWTGGIDGTAIRPGFLKTGVDRGPVSAIDRKLVVAAARTHRGSGLTIACHTGDNPEAALDQLAILKAEGVSPRAWVWVHAHAVKDEAALVRAAEAGAWIELDGLDPGSFEAHLERVLDLRKRGFLGQVLLSHDGDLHPAPGRVPRPLDLLLTTFRHALRDRGLSADEVRRLLVDNPREAFAVRVRLDR
ncbi:MAG TPA: twin-arginine translocation signal domain-containing protein [Vicinamibacteria bacterium]